MAPTELRQGSADRATIVDELSLGGRLSVFFLSIVVSEHVFELFLQRINMEI